MNNITEEQEIKNNLALNIANLALENATSKARCTTLERQFAELQASINPKDEEALE